MESAPPLAYRVLLAGGVIEPMAAAAAAAYPGEACGLLLGRREADELRVELFWPAVNAAGDPRQTYLVPPLELLAADGEARRTGREIVGIWHSHPDAPAWPSRRDRDEAWEGYSYGIHAATREGAGELRFFALANGALREIPWSPVEDAAGESR